MSDLNLLFRNRLGIPQDEVISFQNLDMVLVKTAKAIPFENLCIIENRTKELTEENLTSKILEQNEGGLCYELNSILYLFLYENGFNPTLIRGVTFNQMNQQWSATGNTHVVNRITHNGQVYLVDTGFGEFLPLKPVPISGESVVSSNGEFRVDRVESEQRGPWGRFFRSFLSNRTVPLSPSFLHQIQTKKAKDYYMMLHKNTYIDEILAQYFPAGSWVTWVGQSGANNTTRFVRVDDEQFVLRIYETHQDEDKVKYEHAVLVALAEMPLTFSIPQPVQSRDGKTIVRTRDGKIAGLFRYLDGVNPTLDELTEIHSYGRTAGQLSASLAHVQINQRPSYRPYYEIENTHPRCSLQDVLSFCKNPPREFSEQTTDLLVIYDQLTSFMEQVSTLRKLPHQLVHGDLNASNILINEDGVVSAVLDFEFVTDDLRVMELAVCLSDFIQPQEDETIIWAKINAFLSGYGQSLKLTAAEIEAVPVLIQLRSLDVFIHFLGRYLEKISSIDIVKEYIQKSALRCNWIMDNKKTMGTVLLG